MKWFVLALNGGKERKRKKEHIFATEISLWAWCEFYHLSTLLRKLISKPKTVSTQQVRNARRKVAGL